MNLDLTGKVALVTGSSRGIGLAIAKTLASEGCRIILNARNIEQLENTAKSLNLEHVPGDVCTWAGAKRVVEQATEKAGHLDILVTNVGSGMSVPPGMEDETEWFRMLNLNLMSATNTISAARPTLARQRGVVLCVSSICGIATVGAPLAYSAAKAALNSYVRGVSPALAAEGVRINAIAPGNILFPGSTWERKLRESPETVQKMLDANVPLCRFGTLEEIACLATFLCSAKASFVTGTVVVADGGQIRI